MVVLGSRLEDHNDWYVIMYLFVGFFGLDLSVQDWITLPLGRTKAVTRGRECEQQCF